MKITTNAVIFLNVFYYVLGAYIQPGTTATSDRINTRLSQLENVHDRFSDERNHSNGSSNVGNSESQSTLDFMAPGINFAEPPKTVNTTTPFNNSVTNLVQTIMTKLRRKPATTPAPNKQLLGGTLPPFLERIVQFVQNRYSVYNPPEYFEGSRPPVTSISNGIAVICSNAENDSVSCNPMPNHEYSVVEETCENDVPENTTTTENSEDDGHNFVVTNTIVQDNMVNVYMPADNSSQVVNNLIVILEPSTAQYGLPPQPTPNKDKFYVYVNPTSANDKKDPLQTEVEGEEKDEKPESFQPYSNDTYTVVIRGDKLQEFSNNIDNADNDSLNPEIGSIYIRSNANPCKDPMGKGHCNKGTIRSRADKGTALMGRSAVNEKMDVPNINLVLIPYDDSNGNKSCGKKKFNNKDMEHYILKPDSGNFTKPKDVPKNTLYSLHQTGANATSVTHLPPKKFLANESVDENGQQEVSTTPTTSAATEQSTNRFPLLFNLFHKKPEEPRES